MVSFLIKRILAMVPVFVLIAFVSFGMVSLYPGDFYTQYMLGAAMVEGGLEWIDAMRLQRGLDQPWIVQFWVWFEGVITKGDLGISFATNGSVTKYLFRDTRNLYWTLIITGSSMVIAWLIGIPLGILSAARRRRLLDHVISAWSYFWISIPGYVFGACVLVFVAKFVNPLLRGAGVWGLLDPWYRDAPFSVAKLFNYLWHLWPAWLIVGAPMFASITRHLRVSLIDTFSAAYMSTARGKGLGERQVLFKHALRNAMNPLVSMFGMMIPTLITGSILATQALGLPTFGAIFIQAVKAQDQHVITAALLFYGTIMMLGNVFGDILLAAIDPRIRYS